MALPPELRETIVQWSWEESHAKTSAHPTRHADEMCRLGLSFCGLTIFVGRSSRRLGTKCAKQSSSADAVVRNRPVLQASRTAHGKAPRTRRPRVATGGLRAS